MNADDAHLKVLRSSTGNTRVMCSGIYGEDGPGPLVITDKDESINSTRFAKMLQEDFRPYFVQHGKCVGLYDNAKPHIGGTARGYMHRLGLKKLLHCPNSPDYNCIELPWNRMANMVGRNLPRGYVSRDVMIREIRRAWQVQASAECFQKDLLHVVNNMRKSLACGGGNMYKK